MLSLNQPHMRLRDSSNEVVKIHRIKKGPITAAFLVLFKNATFYLTKREPFISFIMSKYVSGVNYTPSCVIQ